MKGIYGCVSRLVYFQDIAEQRHIVMRLLRFLLSNGPKQIQPNYRANPKKFAPISIVRVLVVLLLFVRSGDGSLIFLPWFGESRGV